MKNIYLDIDGTILLDNLENAGQYAVSLGLFLTTLGNLQADGVIKMYWLTTHCRNGDNTQVLEYLKQRLEPHDFDLIIRMKIKPTTWNEFKTEAIDFSKDFLWLDDDATLQEQEVLKTHKVEHKLVKIDLQKNKYQLKTLVNSEIFS